MGKMRMIIVSNGAAVSIISYSQDKKQSFEFCLLCVLVAGQCFWTAVRGNYSWSCCLLPSSSLSQTTQLRGRRVWRPCPVTHSHT